MKKVAIDKTQIVLKTEYPWKWGNGSELELDVDASGAPLIIGGAPALTSSDVTKGIEKAISGQKYVHFEGANPGVVSALGVRVDKASLTYNLLFGAREPLVCSETKGEFEVSVSTPSILPGTPQIPDPLPTHFGKWWVKNPKQQVCSEGDAESARSPTLVGSSPPVRESKPTQDPAPEEDEHGLDVKKGADIAGLSRHMTDTFDEVRAAFDRHAPGVTPTLTSGTEQAPGRLADSKHYTGDAYDLRTRDLSDHQIDIIVEELSVTLGDDYDIVKKSDHIHVEYDPD